MIINVIISVLGTIGFGVVSGMHGNRLIRYQPKSVGMVAVKTLYVAMILAQAVSLLILQFSAREAINDILTALIIISVFVEYVIIVVSAIKIDN